MRWKNNMKYRVKEFFEDMVWDIDENDWFHAIDGKRLDEQINEFIDDTPNIHIVDIKYWVIEHKNGENESQALLLYNISKRQPYELSPSEYNDEFGVE